MEGLHLIGVVKVAARPAAVVAEVVAALVFVISALVPVLFPFEVSAGLAEREAAVVQNYPYVVQEPLQ